MASRIMVIADETWAKNEVHAALTEPEYTLIDHDEPRTARETVVAESPELVIIDLQVGSMGGMAIARDLHQKAALNHEDAVPVVLLLDRGADSFLAKRAGVAAWVTKPFTSHQIRTAVEHALAK